MKLENVAVQYQMAEADDDFEIETSLDDLDFEEESDCSYLDQELQQFIAERRC